MRGFMYGDIYYLILVLPAMLIALIAQARVRSAFTKYSKIPTRGGQVGTTAAQMVMSRNNVYGVNIVPVAGSMTDHYDPKKNIIALSEPVIHSSSIAAVGVAAHEAGHASQYAAKYVPIRVRNSILPIAKFSQPVSWIMIVIGFILPVQYSFFITIGIVLFSVAVLFQVVTLPIEFDASRRAMEALSASGQYSQEELSGVKKVLSAAAMTYVAGAAVALAQLVRLLLISGRRNRY